MEEGNSEACSPARNVKRQRCTSPRVKTYSIGEALKFATSPTVLSAREALHAYERHPDHFRLRPVENRCLSSEEAKRIERTGGDLLVSPHSLNTNQCLAKLNQFHKDFEDIDLQALRSLVKPIETIYREYLGVTWRFVETDLASMVVYTLDYNIKQAFVRDLTRYEQILVPYPFKDTGGNSVRYFDVLKEYERLSAIHHALSSRENAALRACSELLRDSERRLVHEHGLKFGSRNVRHEMKHLIGSDVRALRMFGTHMFTSMIWEDFTSPLRAQRLSGDLPRAKVDAFQFSELRTLRAMLVRALVLEDMADKFNKSLLDPACRHIHQCGLAVVKAFMCKHVPYSFEVRFKNLRAWIIKENEAQHDITPNHIFDLETFASLV